ncbi:MAG: hypothetical protein Fur007_02200 [Rhodoferax sp.]
MTRVNGIVLVCLGVLGAWGLLTTPAWAIYKCTAADGRVSYQDQACDGALTEQLPEVAAAPASAPTPEAWRAKAAKADVQLAIHAAIERHQPLRGMTLAQLDLAMGAPDDRSVTHSSTGRHEYRTYRRDGILWRVALREDVVDSVSHRALPADKSKPPCPGPQALELARLRASSITLNDAERAKAQEALKKTEQACQAR